MTTQEVANRFYELSQEGKFDTIYADLYSPDAVSIEPDENFLPTAKGMDAIFAKGKQFQEMTEEMHGGYTNAPIVAGNFFACAMGMDITMKGQARSQMDEIAMYEVRDGKIVKEQFFY